MDVSLKKAAALACLPVLPEEEARLKEEKERLGAAIAALRAFDRGEELPPTAAWPNLRADAPVPSMTRDALFACANEVGGCAVQDVIKIESTCPAPSLPEARDGIPALSATALAEAFQRGELSAEEITAAFLKKAEAENERFGAFLTLTAVRALQTARETDKRRCEGDKTLSPLAGVPVAIKDNIQLCGERCTCGSAMLQAYRSPYDAGVVTLLESAGLPILGKTNLDEFSMGASGELSHFFPAKNPIAPGHMVGGSSSGSAAAVAAGLAPLALGSDTGGSLRLPAAFCGLCALKPTYGAISRYGLLAHASSLDQIGPMARTVKETEALFSLLAKRDRRDMTCTGASRTPAKPREALRFAVCTEPLARAAAPVRRAVLSAAEALKQRGAQEVSVSLPEWEIALPLYQLLSHMEAASNLSRYDGLRYGLAGSGNTPKAAFTASRGSGFGFEVRRRLLLGSYALSQEGAYALARRCAARLSAALEAAMESADILLSPTALEPAPLCASAGALLDFCLTPSNLAGIPALTLPFGTDEARLPIGVQLMAGKGRENDLFAAAAILEEAQQ